MDVFPMAVAICCNNHYRVCPLEIIPLRFENNESHLRSSPNRVENHTLCVWKHQAVWGFPSFWIIKAVLFSSSASGLPVRLCCCLPHLSFPETISRALHWHLSHLRWFKNTEREREGERERERERYIYIQMHIYIYILYIYTYIHVSLRCHVSILIFGMVPSLLVTVNWPINREHWPCLAGGRITITWPGFQRSFHKWRYPNGWMVYSGNPNLKWMI